MVHIAPSIAVIKTLRQSLSNGCSVSQSITQSLQGDNSLFAARLRRWFQAWQVGSELQIPFPTEYQRMLVEILKQGLSGCPIYEQLDILESDMEKEFERQWRAHLEALPLKLSLPLLLLFFPAYLILMFGPLVTQFLQEVN